VKKTHTYTRRSVNSLNIIALFDKIYYILNDSFVFPKFGLNFTTDCEVISWADISNKNITYESKK
jgi:hypothetical protein